MLYADLFPGDLVIRNDGATAWMVIEISGNKNISFHTLWQVLWQASNPNAVGVFIRTTFNEHAIVISDHHVYRRGVKINKVRGDK